MSKIIFNDISTKTLPHAAKVNQYLLMPLRTFVLCQGENWFFFFPGGRRITISSNFYHYIFGEKV
jgi:hypothetical protein